MKYIKILFYLLCCGLLLWFCASFCDIVAHNMTTGIYSNLNLFTLIYEVTA